MPRGWELIIIVIVILVLFGPGRISKIAGEIGSSISEFRKGIAGSDDDSEEESDEKYKEEKYE